MRRETYTPDVDGDAHHTADYDYAPDDVQPTRWQRLWRYRDQVIFAVSFLIPFVILGLIGLVTYQIDHSSSPAALTPTPSPTPVVVGVWPLDVPFITHTVPAMIRDEISLGETQHGYQFEGRAGELWSITVEALDTLDPQIYLYEPSGGELAYNDDQYAGSLNAGIQVILPEDGTYRLLVDSAPKSGGSTGTYLLTLFEE